MVGSTGAASASDATPASAAAPATAAAAHAPTTSRSRRNLRRARAERDAIVVDAAKTSGHGPDTLKPVATGHRDAAVHADPPPRRVRAPPPRLSAGFLVDDPGLARVTSPPDEPPLFGHDVDLLRSLPVCGVRI